MIKIMIKTKQDSDFEENMVEDILAFLKSEYEPSYYQVFEAPEVANMFVLEFHTDGG
jgi:hypothetical protein